jgi:hypothetical protein
MNSQYAIPLEHFALLFNGSPSSFLILLPDEALPIVGGTDDYLRDTLKLRALEE